MERKTLQRKEIIESLKMSNNHPTVKELYEIVNKKDNNIGQATVYRTINSLVADGLIKRIDCKSGIHYDYRKDHQHFYCLRCGMIIDVLKDSDLVDNLLLASNLKNVEHVNLVFEGICDDCLKKS